MNSHDQSASFAALLRSAVEEPGTHPPAYIAFHNYRLGNQILALVQCLQRGITPGPIATFMGWKDTGRYVRKGEKAITLCQPVTVKSRRDEEDEGDEQVFTRFVYKPHWFWWPRRRGRSCSQRRCRHGTAREHWPRSASPRCRSTCSTATAGVRAAALDLGVAGRRASVQDGLHEVAHVLLGHTTEGEQADSDITPRIASRGRSGVRCVTVLRSARFAGRRESRGYVQHWGGAGNPIPERSAQRILKAADQILKAGTSTPADGEEPRATLEPHAIAYVRVSTDQQAESGLGLKAQEAAVRSAASRLRLELGAGLRRCRHVWKVGMEDRPSCSKRLPCFDAVTCYWSGNATALGVMSLPLPSLSGWSQSGAPAWSARLAKAQTDDPAAC